MLHVTPKSIVTPHAAFGFQRRGQIPRTLQLVFTPDLSDQTVHLVLLLRFFNTTLYGCGVQAIS